MRLIVGLGNPDAKYLLTRHNLGFWAVDELCALWKIALTSRYAYGIYGQGRVGGQAVTLIKPTTYMNASGICVADMAHKLGVPPQDIMVLYDDMDLPAGKIRVRMKGGAGSHNGMRSILEELQSREFPRVRMGIGEPPEGSGVDFVLGQPRGEERLALINAAERTAGAVDIWLRLGIEAAMRRYNAAGEETNNA